MLVFLKALEVGTSNVVCVKGDRGDCIQGVTMSLDCVYEKSCLLSLPLPH